MKGTSIFVLLFLFCSLLWGETADFATQFASIRNQLENNQVKLDLMLSTKEYHNPGKRAEMAELSLSLTNFEKKQYMDRYQSSGWWCLLNSYLGLGSFIQGDWVGGCVLAGGSLTGFLLLSSSTKADNVKKTSTVTNQTVYSSGYVLLVASFVSGLVWPWFYADEQNKQLRTVLYP